MALTIYGTLRSRALRNMWMAGELGLDYETAAVAPAEAAGHAGLAAVNPNRKVPAVDDDGFALFESLAINLYLAKKHGGPLAPTDLKEDAEAVQWSLWVATEVETGALTVLRHRVLLPEGERDESVARATLMDLVKPLGVLDGVLAQRGHLVGGRFTVADLNVASVLGFLMYAQADFSAFPAVKAWLDASWARPAAAALLARRSG